MHEHPQHRSSSPKTPTLLPSLHERLLQTRQELPDFPQRPSYRPDRATTSPTTLSPKTATLALSPARDDSPELPTLAPPPPPLQPSPSSWSETSSTFSTTSSPHESDSEGKRKRPRFLGDIDRRIIVQRLENGDKQADLAREFGVTRAAICHINKNREEILTRFDILAKSPQGRQMIENYVRSPHFSSYVREIRTPSVSVLLTRLNDVAMSPRAYKSTADRLLSILIEEALVSFGTRPVGVEDVLGLSYEGKEYARPPVALSVADQGRPLLDVFATMEPSAFRVVAVPPGDGSRMNNGNLSWHFELPANASEANVLLFQVALHDGNALDAILQALALRGVVGSRVCVVCVTSAADAVTRFANRHRDVRLVTATIDADAETPRLTGFVERYAEAGQESCS